MVDWQSQTQQSQISVIHLYLSFKAKQMQERKNLPKNKIIAPTVHISVVRDSSPSFLRMFGKSLFYGLFMQTVRIQYLLNLTHALTLPFSTTYLLL